MIMTNTNIALVEDDIDLRDTLTAYLRHSGLTVAATGSAIEFYQLLAQHTFDLVILDINLPDEDGLSIAKFLHEHLPDIGIIIMTARGLVRDRIAGLESGADIYLVKPVQGEELVASIESVLRRLSKTAAGLRQDDEEAVAQSWLFQKDLLRLIAPNGKSVPLTGLESRLLAALNLAGDDIVTQEQLLSCLDYSNDAVRRRNLAAIFVRLRAKIVDRTGASLPVQTLRGKGYKAYNLASE